jgi:hypothetical protein
MNKGGRTAMSVDAFMEALDHPRKGDVEEVRRLILSADAGITEQVKWNAPSFCIGGDDRITLRLQPRNQVQVIFHRGAKAKSAEGFTFDDLDNLAKWMAPDRGMVDFKDSADLNARKAAFLDIVRRWIAATR